MHKYTKDDILRIVQEEDVEFIRLQFTDMFGVLKNLAVTTSQLEKALNDRVLFDGSAIDGFVGIEESDMYLHPDIDTFAIFPWRPQQSRVARFLCNIHYPDGTPFEGDSRYILQKVLARARENAFTFTVGPECEFFLYHLDDNGLPTTLTHENAGFFDVAPLDLGENARREMILTMEEMGYSIEASHHEFAPAQHEIDLHYAEALKAADTITTFRLTARTVAKRHGLYATFMPKPRSGVHGSGMHINISLVRNGINLFEDETDRNGLSREAYWFIGGILSHIHEITAIANPLVNSYKRLMSGYEAPRYAAWSMTNRSSLIRVPATRGFHTRIELRSPDSAANPYLTLALCLAAGLDGIEKRIEPPASVEQNLSSMTREEAAAQNIRQLPLTLCDALDSLEQSEWAKEVLGEHIIGKFIREKRSEWNAFMMHVSEWELKKYLPVF